LGNNPGTREPETFSSGQILSYSTKPVTEKTGGEIIAIDGKTARGSRDRKNNRKPLHMVSAWASQNRLVLGQVATGEKSNEITAIPNFGDDASRIRKGNGPAIMTSIRHLCMNLFEGERSRMSLAKKAPQSCLE